MKNWEKYDGFLSRQQSRYFGVDNNTNEPFVCEVEKCDNCKFGDDEKYCVELRLEWQLEEATERAKKITKFEFEFLNALHPGHRQSEIYRDEEGNLSIITANEDMIELRNDLFTFIDRCECYTIEELLEMEVVEC